MIVRKSSKFENPNNQQPKNQPVIATNNGEGIPQSQSCFNVLLETVKSTEAEVVMNPIRSFRKNRCKLPSSPAKWHFILLRRRFYACARPCLCAYIEKLSLLSAAATLHSSPPLQATDFLLLVGLFKGVSASSNA
ncbi:hypothetical protein PIB30_014352 [Stylosanthes scabra]|uniref:Uncharacterized protein n=1 Tax=Stylosanthes scabra TaxID=79078 RepID=A0ABU6S666_9FABA|nr:hypothetical protein [Stylosanthes scabra]